MGKRIELPSSYPKRAPVIAEEQPIKPVDTNQAYYLPVIEDPLFKEIPTPDGTYDQSSVQMAISQQMRDFRITNEKHDISPSSGVQDYQSQRYGSGADQQQSWIPP